MKIKQGKTLNLRNLPEDIRYQLDKAPFCYSGTELKKGKPSNIKIIRIDRKGWLGNPFIMGKDGNRKQVIKKFNKWLLEKYHKGDFPLETLAAFHGKDLACWCAPKPCHGDIILKASKWAYEKLEKNKEKKRKKSKKKKKKQ